MRYISEAANGLDFLNAPRHLVDGVRVGIQHRDIKPANLLLMGDTVVVGDFGVATTLQEFDATTTAVLGSLAFMSPESFSQKPSQTSDQYALAITYYQLRCNRLPYNANVPLDELIAIHKEGRLNFSEVSGTERDILRRATALDPRKRFDSCRELADTLADIVRPTAIVRRSAVPLWITAAAAICLLAAFTFWLVDPMNWFGQSTPRIVPIQGSGPERKTIVLTVAPNNIRGQYQIKHGDSGQQEEPVALDTVNKLQLTEGDTVNIQAESDSPFLKPIDITYTCSELEDLQGSLKLPEIPQTDIQTQIESLLDQNQNDEATQLYARAARFGGDWYREPKSITTTLEQVVEFVADPSSNRMAVSVRDNQGLHPVVVTVDNNQFTQQQAPACDMEKADIKDLFFNRDGDALIVVRSGALQRWSLGSDSVETLWHSSGPEPTNFSKSRVSGDHRWFAATDYQQNVYLWNLEQISEHADPLLVQSFDRTLVDLVFGPEDKSLLVITESVPLVEIDLTAGSGEKLKVADAVTQPPLDGSAIVAACRVGADSLALATSQALATESQWTTSVHFFGDSAEPFCKPASLDNGMLSELVGTSNSEYFVTTADGDTSVIVWKVGSSEPVLKIGSEKLKSTRDVVFSENGQWVAIASRNGELNVLDLRKEPVELHLIDQIPDSFYKHIGFAGKSRWLFAVPENNASASEVRGESQIHAWDFRHCWLQWDAAAKNQD